jgi:hypothetical protein
MDLINDWCHATRYDPERPETSAGEMKQYSKDCG